MVAVFAGFTIPYFVTLTNSKNLEQESKQIIDVIELAKSKARSSEADIPGCFVFRGYRIHFDNPATQYRLRACCSSAASPDALCAVFQDLNIYKLHPGQSLSFSANLASPNNFIHFTNLKIGTTLSSSGVIKVISASTNKCIPITVNRLGLITEGNKQPLPC
jgi:hypothetical protein